VKKNQVLLTLVLVFLLFVSSNAFAANNDVRFSNDHVVQTKNRTILGEEYEFVEQFYFNKGEKSFVKMKFNNYNALKKTSMGSLSFYSRLFENKPENKEKFNIYYNEMKRELGSQFEGEFYRFNPDYLKGKDMNEEGFVGLILNVYKQDNKMAVISVNKIQNYYWLQYDILYK